MREGFMGLERKLPNHEGYRKQQSTEYGSLSRTAVLPVGVGFPCNPLLKTSCHFPFALLISSATENRFSQPDWPDNREVTR